MATWLDLELCRLYRIFVSYFCTEILYTIVPLLGRKTLSDYVVTDNPKLVIERGIQIINPAHHLDEDLYPQRAGGST